jgi:hypothetical protein
MVVLELKKIKGNKTTDGYDGLTTSLFFVKGKK